MASKVLFFKIPKTASSSIERALEQLHHRKVIIKMRSYGHGVPSIILKRENSYWDIIRLISVRNPYSRLLSGYKYILENKRNKPEHKWVFESGDFRTFCKRLSTKIDWKTDQCRFYHPQLSWLLINNQPSYTHLLRYETLSEDWDAFTKKTFKTSCPLPRLRPSKHKPWQEVYDEKTKKIVYEMYQSDFEYLGYKK